MSASVLLAASSEYVTQAALQLDAGAVKLEVQLFHARNLTEPLLEDLASAAHEADGGDPSTPVAAAERKLRLLCAMDGRVLGGTKKLGPLKKSYKDAQAALKSRDYGALDAIIESIKKAYAAVLEHDDYFNRGVRLAEGGLVERVKGASLAFHRPYDELRKNFPDFVQHARDLDPELPRVLETGLRCFDGLYRDAVAVESATAATRQSRRRTSRNTATIEAAALKRLLATADKCTKDMKKFMPKDLSAALNGRLHRALLEETGEFYPAVLHAIWLRMIAIQYFKVVRLNAEGIDGGDKKLRSAFVTERGGTTVKAMESMLDGACIPTNHDRCKNLKMKQPYVPRVKDMIAIDFRPLFRDETFGELLENLRLQLSFLAYVYDDPVPTETLEMSCTALVPLVEKASASARVTLDLLWPPMKNRKNEKIYAWLTQSANDFFFHMQRTFKRDKCSVARFNEHVFENAHIWLKRMLHEGSFPAFIKGQASSEVNVLRAAFATRRSRLQTSTYYDQAVKNHKLRSKDLAFVQTLAKEAVAFREKTDHCFLRGSSTGLCGALRNAYRYAWTKDADGVVTYPKENTFEPPVRTQYMRGASLDELQEAQEEEQINDTWDRGADEDQGGAPDEDALDAHAAETEAAVVAAADG